MMTRFLLLPLFFAFYCAPACAKQLVRVPLPAGFRPAAIAVADLDGDRRVDVALCGSSGQLLVLAGELRPVPQSASCGQNPSEMIAADLDGDGRIDLAVANHDTDYITVLHNDGAAHFTAQRLNVHSKPHPHTVAAADLNGDKRVDLIVDSWGENRLTLLFANAAGRWQTPGTTIDAGRKPYINVRAVDLDGDGNIDLVMPNQGFDTVSVLFGDGHGNFQPIVPIVAGPTPFMIAVADVNGDGRPDILVANYSGHMSDTSRDGLTWVRNDGHRRFTAFPQRIAAAPGAWRVAAGDVNGDGIADAVFVNGGEDTITIAFGSKEGLRPGPKMKVMPHPHNIAIGERRIYVITEERDELDIVTVR